MVSDKNNKILKLISDDRNTKILQILNTKEGMQVKELAKIMEESPSVLYYPISKLENAGLLKIVKEEKIKNLTTLYYSSTHIFNQTQISIEKDILKNNIDEITAYYYVEAQKFIKSLNQDVSNYSLGNETTSHAQFNVIDIELDDESAKELTNEIIKILNNYMEKKKSNPLKSKYRYIISSYSTNNIK